MLVAVIVFAVAFCSVPAGATSGWLPQQKLGPESLFDELVRPEVAMNARGEAVAAWNLCSLEFCERSDFLESSSRAPGGSWQSPVDLSSPGLHMRGEPGVAIDSRGDEAAIATLTPAKAEEIIQVALRPAGAGWESPVILEEGCAKSFLAAKPQIALDAHGDALAAWRCEKEGHVEIHARFRPLGDGWQAVVTLAEEVQSCSGGCREVVSTPRVALDANGNGFVSWTDSAREGAGEVDFRPASGSWAAPVQVGEDGVLGLALDGAGNAYALVYSDTGSLEVVYRPVGGSWQTPATVFPHALGQIPYAFEPALAVGTRGDAMVVWDENEESGGQHIFAARKPAGGGWQPPVEVGEAFGVPEPQAALDSHGDALAAWTGGPGEGTPLVAAREPAGGTWQSVVTVSGHPERSGEQRTSGPPSLAVSAGGNGVVAWGWNFSTYPVAGNDIEVAGFDAGPELEALSVPSAALVGQPVSFSVSPLGVWSAPGEVTWAFGDGLSASGASVSHSYSKPGTHEVTVEAQDALGQRSHASATIEVRRRPVETFEPRNWLLAGSLLLKRLGQPITLPAGSTLNGSGELNTETGAGSLTASIFVPPFTATLKLFRLLPVRLGLTLSQTAPLEGTLVRSTSLNEGERLTIPAKVALGVTSLAIFGLEVPVQCRGFEPLSLPLVADLGLEQLLSEGWQFAGTATVPRFKCEGPMGAAVSVVLNALLSGPEDAYSISATAPGG